MGMKDDMNYEGVYAAEVIEFVKIANSFCSWLESCDQQNGLQFIQKAVVLLPSVYHRILLFQDTEPVLEGGNEKFVTEKEWSDIFQNILHLLGPHNSYLRLADDQEFDRSDLVTHTISEDMADIYQDLKDFTLQFRQGIEEIMNDAIWELMSSFEQYWGAKLLNSLRALHNLYVKKIDPQDEIGSDLPFRKDQDHLPKYDNSLFTKLQDSNEEDF